MNIPEAEEVLYAIYWGKYDDFELLTKYLENGGDPNVVKHGYGTFLEAVLLREKGEQNTVELIDLLIKYNCDPFIKNIEYKNEIISANDLVVKLFREFNEDMSIKEHNYYDEMYMNILRKFEKLII